MIKAGEWRNVTANTIGLLFLGVLTVKVTLSSLSQILPLCMVAIDIKPGIAGRSSFIVALLFIGWGTRLKYHAALRQTQGEKGHDGQKAGGMMSAFLIRVLSL